MERCTHATQAFTTFLVFILFSQGLLGEPTAVLNRKDEYRAEFVGIAYKDRSKKEVAFKEKHSRTYSRKKITESVTEYFDPDGSLIAKLEVDYAGALQTSLPGYVFTDQRFAIRESSVVIDPTSLSPSVRFEYTEGEVKKELKIEGDMSVYSASQGLAERITDNFRALESGKTVDTEFVVPKKGRSVGMSVTSLRQSSSELVVSVKIKSALIGFVAWISDGPIKIDMAFDKITKRILWIDGRSTLLDKNKKSQDVFIEYDYSTWPNDLP